ncbi:MAG: helix-turn-helix domain-containing protein [Candidatus Magasanikbacteria bacterium]|jgi:sugar-specific transcriptional regulator TrmB
MDKKQIIDLFQKMGLNEKEALVYFALLSSDASKISKISDFSGIKRTTVYPVLRELQKKGLVFQETCGFKNVFKAQSPEYLRSTTETLLNFFDKQLPELLDVTKHTDTSNNITYYQGLVGIKAIYNNLLTDTHLKDPHYIISDSQKFIDMDKNFAEQVAQKRARLNLDLKIITVPSKTADHFKKFEKNFNNKIKFLPTNIKFDAGVIITKSQIAFITFQKPFGGTLIKNELVSSLMMNTFNIIWELL